MDRNLHRPIPTKQSFTRFTTLLGQNHIEDEDDYSLDEGLPDFVPSTQRTNETIISDFVPSMQRTNEPIIIEDHSSSQHSKCQDQPPLVSQTQKGRTRWSISDTKILIEAKCIEKDTLSTAGAMKKTATSVEKWKIVQDYCSHHGVIRTTNQCRDRWEHVLPDYKKIRDYEAHIPSGHDSYWNMTSKERIEKKLLASFPNELMITMEINFGNDRAIDLGNISIDTSENNSPNENAPIDDFDTLNTACPGSENIDNETEKGYTGKKRKLATFKTSGMKDTILENNKLVVSTLQIAEEGRMKRHEKEYALMERRLQREELNDEKMVAVQINLVAAISSIGQAMLKISESFSNEK